MIEVNEGDLSAIVSRLRRFGTDTPDVEVKSSVRSLPSSLASTVSAFSNGSGGLVILGLDENSEFSPAPGFNPVAIAESFKDLVRVRGHREAAGPLTPAPIVQIDFCDFEGAVVVIGQVSELPADQKPCFVTAQGKENGSYERLVDGDHRMGTHAVYLLSSNRTQPTRDQDPVAGTSIADLDQELVEGLIRRIRRNRPRVAQVGGEVEGILRQLRVLSGASNELTLGGLLALGKLPQSYFPQLMVSFASYPGVTKDSIVGDIRMLDRATFEGPIPVMVEDALEKLVASLQTRRVSRGAGAMDVLEVPVDALREALVNALAHRDYSPFAESEQVSIDVYPDRIEVTNPGGIWGGRPTRELFDGVSRSRNASLTRLLVDVPFSHSDQTVSENAGSGILRMVGTMAQQGLPVPSFDVSDTRFVAKMARHGLMDPETDIWLGSIGATDLAENERKALALARSGRGLDDQVLRFQLGMDSLDALMLIRTLTEEGWLRREGRNSRYSVLAPRAMFTDSLPLFEIVDSPDLESQIQRLIAGGGDWTVRQIAEALGANLGSIRNRLRSLVEAGAITPTAGPTSKNRAYRIQQTLF